MAPLDLGSCTFSSLRFFVVRARTLGRLMTWVSGDCPKDCSSRGTCGVAGVQAPSPNTHISTSLTPPTMTSHLPDHVHPLSSSDSLFNAFARRVHPSSLASPVSSATLTVSVAADRHRCSCQLGYQLWADCSIPDLATDLQVPERPWYNRPWFYVVCVLCGAVRY